MYFIQKDLKDVFLQSVPGWGHLMSCGYFSRVCVNSPIKKAHAEYFFKWEGPFLLNLYILPSSFQNPNLKKKPCFCLLKKIQQQTNSENITFVMGKEATGFNISKENYTWSKERNRRGTDLDGGQTTCTVHSPLLRGLLKQTHLGGQGAALSPCGRTNRPKALMIAQIQTNHSICKITRAFNTCLPSLPRFSSSTGGGRGQTLGNRGSQDVRVLHQLLLVIPRAPDGAEGALLVPPRQPDQADHGGSQQEDQDHHEQPHQDHHCR